MLAIQAKPIHRHLLEAEDGQSVVLHAPLDGRFLEAALASALKTACSGGDAILVVKESVRARFLLSTWTDKVKAKTSTLSTKEIKATGRTLPGQGTVWVIEGETINPSTLPVRRADATFVLDSHLRASEPEVVGPVTFVGEMPETSHWFYKKAFDTPNMTVVSIRESEIRGSFPDQSREGLREEDPAYERMMLLKDVAVNYGDQTFDSFAAERLFVKSDKPVSFLTKRQRDYAKNQLTQKQRIIPFDVHAGQRVYLDRKEQIHSERGGKPWFIVLKSRRIGITATEQALSYRTVATQPFSDVATLAHNIAATQRIFGMVSMFHQKDPRSLTLRTKGSRSALQLSNGSNFFIGTAGGEGFLRGDGVARVHWSEVSKSCRGPNQMAKVEDLWSGISGAASHGEITLETTANGREWFYAQWGDAKAGLSELKPVFLPWFDDPLNRLQPSEFNEEELLDELTDEEARLVRMHGLDMAQIAFRRQGKRIYKRLMPQELPEDDQTCFLASGVCFFDIDVVRRLMETVLDTSAMRKHIPGGYEVRWEEPEPDVEYVIGVDTSEGIPGQDRGGCAVLNKKTGVQVASLHGYFRPRILGAHCVRMSKDYNNALLGVERQNHGHAVIQAVEDHGLPWTRPHFRGGSMFYYVQGNELKTSRSGWSTDGKTRDFMLDDLADAVHEGAMTVKCREFVDEMSAFNLQTNNKYEADAAAHDDHVMKWAIAWQMRGVRVLKPTITVLNGARSNGKVAQAPTKDPSRNGNGAKR